MNVETKRAQVDQAMADIERKLDIEISRERPTIGMAPPPRYVIEPKAVAPQTLPAMLAQMLAVIEAGDEQLGRRLARIEAFLGIEP